MWIWSECGNPKLMRKFGCLFLKPPPQKGVQPGLKRHIFMPEKISLSHRVWCQVSSTCCWRASDFFRWLRWPLKAGGYGFTPGLSSSNVASCGETNLRNAGEAVFRARAADREALLGLLRVKGHFLPSQEEVILETDLLSSRCLWSRPLC